MTARFEFSCPKHGVVESPGADEATGFPKRCEECGLTLRLRVLERRAGTLIPRKASTN